jgi:hypothetical protein
MLLVVKRNIEASQTKNLLLRRYTFLESKKKPNGK